MSSRIEKLEKLQSKAEKCERKLIDKKIKYVRELVDRDKEATINKTKELLSYFQFISNIKFNDIEIDFDYGYLEDIIAELFEIDNVTALPYNCVYASFNVNGFKVNLIVWVDLEYSTTDIRNSNIQLVVDDTNIDNIVETSATNVKDIQEFFEKLKTSKN